MNLRKVTEGIAIAGQPTAEDIEALRAQGYRTVVNLRAPGDTGVLEDEERVVEGSGLNYAAIPVTPQLLDDLAMQRFTQAIDSADGQPAVVHCGSGGRAGVLALIHLAIHHGWTVEQALAEGAQMGDLAPGEASSYRPFFESYIRRHSAGERV